VAPTPERILLSRMSFSIIRIEFRNVMVIRNVAASSFSVVLWMIFSIEDIVAYISCCHEETGSEDDAVFYCRGPCLL